MNKLHYERGILLIMLCVLVLLMLMQCGCSTYHGHYGHTHGIWKYCDEPMPAVRTVRMIGYRPYGYRRGLEGTIYQPYGGVITGREREVRQYMNRHMIYPGPCSGTFGYYRY